jgi:oligoribonuclease NrnB/cAMP/cGMP phosphodiesterase (DHH superfamily)
MRMVVATHGHCFDGLASAVVFTRLLRVLSPELAAFEYRACGYGAGQVRASDAVFTGDQNAILDYRYARSPRLDWYFDHHRTAFGSDEDRADFESKRDGGKLFFDPAYSSCTKLVFDVARERFDFADPALDELVAWADRVDSARFESAEQAVDRQNPVMQLVSVIEHYGDDAFLNKLVPELEKTPLAEVAVSREVSDRYRPLGRKHERYIERVKTRSERRGRVVFVDLTETVLESVGKFVTYALYPDSVYSVVVGLLKNGPKISVGYNPWSGKPLDTDISSICARYGGGGHPVVGGISFELHELDRARNVARTIADELEG